MPLQGLSLLILFSGPASVAGVRSQFVSWSVDFDDELEFPSHYSIDRDWRYGGYLRLNTSNFKTGAEVELKGQGSSFVKWAFNTNVGTVVRTGSARTDSEWWGLLPPNELDGEVYLDFERVHDGWEVSINGKRMPWFDYEDEPMEITSVHWRNIERPRLSLFYRHCDTPCDEAECTECTVDGITSAASRCRSISPSGSKLCGIPTTDEVQCCRGSPPALKFSSYHAGDWVVVSEDDDIIRRGCVAFDNDPEKCAIYKGLNVRVLSKDSVTRKMELWAPKLNHSMNPIYIPVFILNPKAATYTNYIIPHDGGLDISVNPNNKYIYAVKGRARDAGVPTQQYMNRINNKPFTPDRWKEVSTSNRQFTITVVDVEKGFGSCADHVGWKDTDKDTCEDYRKGDWCTLQGQATTKYKGYNSRCWLVFRCPYNITSMRDPVSALTAPDACCACGGGYFNGAVIAPTPPPTPVPTPAPTPAPPTPETTSKAQPGNPATTVFFVGADDKYPLHMGKFTLDVWQESPPDTGLATYENMFHHLLYFNTSTSRWIITDKADNMLVAEEESQGQNPADDLADQSIWTRGNETFTLYLRSSMRCGNSDCWCPQPEHECKADVRDLSCYEGQIMQPVCGTLAKCCSQREICDVNRWAQATNEGCGGIQLGAIAHTTYCDGECDKSECCAQTCWAFAAEECPGRFKNQNTSMACPPPGCDKVQCCKDEPITTTAEPTTTSKSPQTIIPCDECVGEKETEREVLVVEIRAEGLSYPKLVENYVVRTAAYASMRTAISNTLKPQPPLDPIQEEQCVLRISPGEASYIVLEVILLADVETLPEVKDVVNAAFTDKSLPTALKESLQSVTNIRSVTKSTVENIKIVEEYHEVKVMTAIHSNRLGQDIGTRRGFDIWLAHARGTFWETVEWTGENILWVGIAVVAVGVVSAVFTYWLNMDDEDRDDVVG